MLLLIKLELSGVSQFFKKLSGCYPEFNGEEDDWDIYQEGMEQFFCANAIGKTEWRSAILLSLMGEEAYKLLWDLCYPKLPSNKRYDNLCKLLWSHFTKGVSVQFGDSLNLVMRDKFVTGMCTSLVLDKLCKEDKWRREAAALVDLKWPSSNKSVDASNSVVLSSMRVGAFFKVMNW